MHFSLPLLPLLLLAGTTRGHRLGQAARRARVSGPHCASASASASALPALQRELRKAPRTPHSSRAMRHAAARETRMRSSMGPEYDAVVEKILNPPPLFGSPEEATDTALKALGVVFTSFIGTFFLAPQFSSTLKEEERWSDIYETLTNQGIKEISANEASQKAGKGAFLLDVRMENKFSEKSLPNSVNIPLYRPIQLTNPVAILRALAFAFFGVSNSERTPQWLETVESRIPKNKPVYIVCNSGGSLENKPGTKFGFESQSLKALHFLRKAGYQNVIHVKEGIRQIKI